MAIASLDKTGFSREGLVNIKTAIDAAVTEAIGPVNTAADSVVGQYDGVMAEKLALLAEALEDVYFSMYPGSASGVSLDNAVAFTGIERIKATYTKAIAVCYGDDATVLPVGSIASTEGGVQYRSPTQGLISASSAAIIELSVSDVKPNTEYRVVMGPVVMTYTSSGTADADEILNGLAVSTTVLTTSVNNGVLRVETPNRQTGYSVVPGDGIAIGKVGSPILFVADDIGNNPLPAGALTRIVTTVSGWDSVNNPAPAVTGANAESDAALRARHAIGVRGVGNATVKAIRARLLQEVDGVTSCSIYENRSNAPSPTGQPPHSFEAVVEGGFDQAVAAKIFESKAAGIETYGNTRVFVVDENGDSQEVHFTRPAKRYIWLRISGTRYTEEVLPSGYKDSITAACVAYGETLGVGNDVIVQRFYGKIFGAVDGIATVSVEAAVTAGSSESPTYGTANIPVSKFEIADFDVSRVIVNDM